MTMLRPNWLWWALPVLAIPAWVYAWIRPSTGAILGAQVLCYVLLLAAGLIIGIRHVRNWRRFARLGGRMCLRCGFDLRGLPDAGRCPECGEPFDTTRAMEGRP